MTSMLNYAADYAEARYEVFPLRGKVPLIKNAHSEGDPLYGVCKGECGQEGHGVLDATTDMAQIYSWWRRWPTAGIGLRVPENMVVIDVDPRHNGEHSLLDLVRKYGPLPPTRTSYSGRGDGGRHYWWLHPGGKLSATRLGKGLDVKTHAGYVVAPPSLHPDTGRAYWWARPRVKPVLPPAWLTALLLPPPEPPRAPRPSHALTGPTLADQLAWSEILEPHGWRVVGSGHGESDGSKWRHPNATAPWSATIRHGLLFTYSTSTEFPATEAGNPHGLTKLRAYAILNARGDCKAAYKLLQSGAVNGLR